MGVQCCRVWCRGAVLRFTSTVVVGCSEGHRPASHRNDVLSRGTSEPQKTNGQGVILSSATLPWAVSYDPPDALSCCPGIRPKLLCAAAEAATETSPRVHPRRMLDLGHP